MPKKIKLSELMEQVENLEKYRGLWQALDDPAIRFTHPVSGYTCNGLNATMSNHLQILYEFITTNDFEPRCAPILLALDRFYARLVQWAQEVDNITRNNSTGRPVVWESSTSPDAAVAFSELDAEMLKARREAYREFPKPEKSVVELTNMGCTDHQIAKIYSFLKEPGNPDSELDLERVRRERMQPGSEFDEKTWQSKEQWRLEAKWNDFLVHREVPEGVSEALGDNVVEEGHETSQPLREPAPEPLEVLLQLPGMTIEQVARMKHMTVPEVREAQRRSLAVQHVSDLYEAIGTLPDGHLKQELSELAGDPKTPTMSAAELKNAVDTKVRDQAAKYDTFASQEHLQKQIRLMLDTYPAITAIEVMHALKHQYPHVNVDVINAVADTDRTIIDNSQTREEFERWINSATRSELFSAAKDAGLPVSQNTIKSDLIAVLRQSMADELGDVQEPVS